MIIIIKIIYRKMQKIKKRVAIIGTNGIPAKYGGFETLAENLVTELNEEFNFTVYCSSIYKKDERKKWYKKARLIYIPLKANGVQSLFYDSLCFIHSLFYAKTILLLGPTPSGIITFLNIFFRRNLIVNHGGLNEWEREKYSKSEKKWAKINHFIGSKCASVNITDNSILQKSLEKTFNSKSVIIRYGGDHNLDVEVDKEIKEEYSFLKNKYFLCVARAQVDNNLHLLIDAFKDLDTHPLVIVSNWNISNYGKKLLEENKNHPNLILLDAIYDINILNFVRKNSYLYIHSHSYCGTAPSLVEAMNLNIPIICYDVPTNRESTQNKSIYFSSKDELKECVINITEESLEKCKKELFDIAKSEYSWKEVSKQYSKIF